MDRLGVKWSRQSIGLRSFKSLKGGCKIVSHFLMNRMTWKELWVICRKSAAEIYNIFIIFKMAAFWLFLWKVIEHFEQNKIIVNLKLLEENWYNLQENHNLWKAAIWWQAENVALLVKDLEVSWRHSLKNWLMLPFWNWSRYENFATADLQQITHSSFWEL